MDVDEKSKTSRMWSPISMNERDTFRMRRSAVPQLEWLYRHSPVLRRNRGDTRFAGSAGNGGALQPSRTVAALALRLADHLVAA